MLFQTKFVDIEWPVGEEELSEAAQNAIDNLLTLDPNLRPSANGVRAMPLFSNVNWDDMDSMKVPFIPQPDDYADTYYLKVIGSIPFNICVIL